MTRFISQANDDTCVWNKINYFSTCFGSVISKTSNF